MISNDKPAIRPPHTPASDRQVNTHLHLTGTAGRALGHRRTLTALPVWQESANGGQLSGSPVCSRAFLRAVLVRGCFAVFVPRLVRVAVNGGMGVGVEDHRDPQEEEHEREDGDDNGSKCRSGHGGHLQTPLHRRGSVGTSPAQGDARAKRVIAASIAARLFAYSAL